MTEQCQNCGGSVSDDFARVYTKGTVHACIQCTPREAIRRGAAAEPSILERTSVNTHTTEREPEVAKL